MIYKVLEKGDLKDFISELIKHYKVIGPKKIEKNRHDFLQVKNFEEIDLGYKKTTLPPAKKILFPSSEELVSYKFGDGISIEALNESEEKILFGINAWDLNGMNFLDRLFSSEYIDQNYVVKRSNLIVIGYDTEPSDTNFSMSMGADDVKEGFDLFVSDIGNRFFIRVGTPRGNELLQKFSNPSEAKVKDFQDYDRFKDNYKKKFKIKANIKDFYNDFEAVYGNEELWDKLSEKCFSCGSCNLVCPTCFCFNVRDDMKIDLKEAVKKREWDSCMIPEYGLVAGGHNFRPTRANRLKQRYRCKLKTFVDKYGNYACVGCGRCVETCLAKINIYEDINSIKEEVGI